jgi:hypothetical protein
MQQTFAFYPMFSAAVRRQVPGSSRTSARSESIILAARRSFASKGQQEPPFSGSSEAASDFRNRLESEAKAAPGANAKFGPERLGPFPMGGGRVRAKKWAPWKDLDIGGKSESEFCVCSIILLTLELYYQSFGRPLRLAISQSASSARVRSLRWMM